MFNIFQQWQERCKALQISISELCRLTGADRKTVERLKERVPKSLKNYLIIEKKLGEMERASNPAGAENKA